VTVRISVVIPTYNRARLLAATLDAVLTQTLPAQEIIVVDDGSQDDTLDLLKRYAPRVRTIAIENSGDLAARNAGVRAATGDLLAFCDSDDIWRPGHLEVMAELWRREPATRCAYADFVILRDGVWEALSKFTWAGRCEFWPGLRTDGPMYGWFDFPIVDRVVKVQPFFPSCMVVERQFFLSVGGWDERVPRMGGDAATAMLMAEHPPLGVYRGPPQVGIRKHGSNLSRDDQALTLGTSRMLEQLLISRPSLARHAEVVGEAIVTLRLAALHTAFAHRDFQVVQEIEAMLPPERKPAPVRVKGWVAALPAPVRSAVAAGLLAAGSAKAGLRGG
jgi:hypothetical protein